MQVHHLTSSVFHSLDSKMSFLAKVATTIGILMQLVLYCHIVYSQNPQPQPPAVNPFLPNRTSTIKPTKKSSAFTDYGNGVRIFLIIVGACFIVIGAIVSCSVIIRKYRNKKVDDEAFEKENNVNSIFHQIISFIIFFFIL